MNFTAGVEESSTLIRVSEEEAPQSASTTPPLSPSSLSKHRFQDAPAWGSDVSPMR
ncbi:MAG: hypothetical protein M1819_007399 [Sarea resinae]|nr:MAG: hypothetical protein M1819_007399 [Sarea resinae]